MLHLYTTKNIITGLYTKPMSMESEQQVISSYVEFFNQHADIDPNEFECHHLGSFDEHTGLITQPFKKKLKPPFPLKNLPLNEPKDAPEYLEAIANQQLANERSDFKLRQDEERLQKEIESRIPTESK